LILSIISIIFVAKRPREIDCIEFIDYIEIMRELNSVQIVSRG